MLLLAAFVYITFQVRGMLQHLDVILADQLHAYTKRAVRVGKVDINRPGVAVVEGIEISNGPSFSDGTLLKAEKVVLKYRLSDLLKKHKVSIQTIESITLESPTVRLDRYRSGKLNISDLLKPKKVVKKRPPFIGVIYVKNAKMVFRDWQSKMAGIKPVQTTAVDINGMYDASNSPTFVYAFTAKDPSKKKFNDIGFSGSIDGRRKVMSVDIAAGDADVVYWWKYLFKDIGAIKLIAARGDIRFSATRRIVNGRRLWKYIGSTDVRHGKAMVSGFKTPASNIRGTVRLANDIVKLNLDATAASSPIKVTGEIVDFRKPKVQFNIASSNANYKEILASTTMQSAASKQVELIGRGKLNVGITGQFGKLVFSVDGNVPTVRSKGYTASNVHVKASYYDGLVDINRASAGILDGNVVLSGAVDLKSGGTLDLSGSANKVSLGKIPQTRNLGLEGVGSGPISIGGTSAKPQLQAKVQVNRGKFNKLVFSKASASILVSTDGVQIEGLSASTSSGVVRAAGTVMPKKLDLKLVGIGVDVNSFAHAFGFSGYAGIGNFRGEVTGVPSNPTVSGSVEVFNGAVQSVKVDYARGDIKASRSSIALKNTIVRVLPAEIKLNGKVDHINGEIPDIDLDVSVTEAPIGRIIKLTGTNVDITGNTSAHLRVKGSLPKMVMSGDISITDGSVAGYPVTSANANIAFSNGMLKLTGLTAKSDGSELSAEGSMNSDGELDFAFDVKNIALVKLAKLTGHFANLSGTASVNGKLTGTTGSPKLSAKVVADHPLINTVQFDSIAANIGWDGENVSAADVLVSRNQGKIAVGGFNYSLRSRNIDVKDGVIENFDFPAVYTMVIESPYMHRPDAEWLRSSVSKYRRPTTGVFSAKFDATGPFKDLQSNVKVTAGNINVGNIGNVKLDFSASTKNGSVLLNNLDITADSLNVSASGTLIADGKTDLEVDAYNLDLGALTPATGPMHVVGTATVRASIKGNITSPVVQASVEMVDPTIYGVKFDRLRASQIEINQSAIDISRVQITKDEHSAMLYGKIPWSWESFSIPVDEKIDLHASLEEQSLDILTIFTDAIAKNRTGGMCSASVDLTGTVRDPDLSGRLTITNGKIGVRYLENDFSNIQADIQFEKDIIKVAQFSGVTAASSKDDLPGTFEVVPGGTISLKNVINPVGNQPRGAINLVVNANNLRLSELNMFGYSESVGAKVATEDNGISITGPITDPLIAGQLIIDDGTAILSKVAASPKKNAVEYTFNPKFDIAFNLGNNNWFRNPSLNAQVQGGGKLTGSLKKPVVNAAIEIAKGTLRLPTQRMRVSQGIVNVAWNAPEDPHVTVDMSAVTSVSATDQLGVRRRFNIVLTVRGPLNNLQDENIDLKSDPTGLSRMQILAALGHLDGVLGNGQVPLTQQLGDIFSVAAPLLFQPIEKRFIDALGLEDFTIEYGLEKPLAVYVSTNLVDNFYLSYWGILNGSPGLTGSTYSLKLSYRLRDWLEIGCATDSNRSSIIEAAFSHRF